MTAFKRSAIDIAARLYEALDGLVAAEQERVSLEDMRKAGLFAEARAAREEWKSCCEALSSVRMRIEEKLALRGLAIPRSRRIPWYRVRRSKDS